MSPKKYVLTMRSKTTAGFDTTLIEVHAEQQAEHVASAVAQSYGCTVESFVPLLSAREALRECLGCVEAWQEHLRDVGRDRAAQEVGQILDRARASYQHSN